MAFCAKCGSQLPESGICSCGFNINNTGQPVQPNNTTPQANYYYNQPPQPQANYSYNQVQQGYQKRGTSIVPLIMGIIGAILMIPGLACSVCIGGLVSLGSSLAGYGGAPGAIIVILGIIPIITGIVGGVKGKSNPSLSMTLLIVSAVIACIAWILTIFTSWMFLVALILFIIGAIVAKTQKME